MFAQTFILPGVVSFLSEERLHNGSEMPGAVRNPVDVVTKIDKWGRISTQYRGTQSTVVLNEIGKLVSC